jgi:hypothetical protein
VQGRQQTHLGVVDEHVDVSCAYPSSTCIHVGCSVLAEILKSKCPSTYTISSHYRD